MLNVMVSLETGVMVVIPGISLNLQRPGNLIPVVFAIWVLTMQNMSSITTHTTEKYS